MFKSRTPNHTDSQGNDVDGSIASIKRVKIGGVDQYILLRGIDRNNPILLFLHGGPGAAQIGFARHYQTDLEKHFLVVNWDQRGSGKSYSRKINPTSMNIEQFIQDTHELIQVLLHLFGHKKLFLAGHSWGSIIGAMTARRYPELIHAYIGIGQMVDARHSMLLSYQKLLTCARKKDNQKAIRQLNRIGHPPYDKIRSFSVYQKWLKKFGGSIRGGTFTKIFAKGFSSTEYTLNDWYRFRKGLRFSAQYLGEEILKANLLQEVPELKVPAYFCTGRHDCQAPWELQEQYFADLTAPAKQMIWFENSAHAPHFEEPFSFFIQCLRIKEEVLTPHLKRSLFLV
ncbi:alpha/beta fold hydrolase [Lihuaxuella thermophila]|uniref:Pimeloyl-ACP methyl ester carboxylesterase n=1 Tax=Lihuaxuella thermophila TaxID=1173111 RepID=A0A1H8IJ96_9BACL|nr:alpha/beta hydrolase [Lihuaxuella thermophila]SEN67768.1 Pimeloyl-ACP methyl ester carboxylesterase [Lihuaxuella thermophila]